ncbi:MAG: long-chain fatty acid--CoA ligase [Bacteroidales bacterium]|nr:long-chain fatty acid--CoA ligase [Bacteroidales bacterium]
MVKRTFDFLSYAEQHFPSDRALSVKRNGQWEHFSTADYREKVELFSLGLLKMGFKKGDKIATVSNNRPEWNFMDFGLSQIGCVHVSIYPTISRTEYEHILSHSDARILIVANAELLEKLEHFVKEIKSLEAVYTLDEISGVKNWNEILELGRKNRESLNETLVARRDEVQEDDLLTLIYTSGTTGLSKGVMLTHKNVVSNVYMAQDCLTDLKPGDRALSFLPLCHILERTGNYLWQSVGLEIHYAESIETLFNDLQDVKAHAFITVPRVFEKVYDKIILKGRDMTGFKKNIFFWAIQIGDRFDPDPKKQSLYYRLQLALARKLVLDKWKAALGGELKNVISGGAALQPRLARIFWAARIIVQEGYGLTETSPVVSANMPYFPYVRFGSVGLVAKGVQVKIAEDGEVLVKGENVMKGYYKDEEKTKEAIDEEGWFHTGDIGELDDMNILKITDRKKEIFKLSGGKYVAPQMVENVMKESMFIEQIMVLGENRKFTSALVVPDFEYLHKWAYLHHVKYRDNDELVSKPKVIERYQQEVDLYNKQLDHVQQIKEFRLVPDTWSGDTGELSPTLKLKRKVIKSRYPKLIEDIYGGE